MEPIVFDPSSPAQLRQFFRTTKSLGIPTAFWDSNPSHAETTELLASHGYRLIEFGGPARWV